MILINNHIPQHPFQKQIHCTYYIYIVFSFLFYKVLVTLRFLAKGDYLSEVADLHGISLPSTSRALHSVCHALNNKLDNIRFPTTQNEINSIKDGFYKIAHFPNVVGAIDGTLIPIQGMSGDDEPNFICRKGFPSINVQGIVDANLR